MLVAACAEAGRDVAAEGLVPRHRKAGWVAPHLKLPDKDLVQCSTVFVKVQVHFRSDLLRIINEFLKLS